MSKLAVANGIVRVVKSLKWVALGLTLIWFGLLLWMWAAAHFVSFAVVMSVLLVVAMIMGGHVAYDWAVKYRAKAELDERIAQYKDKYGVEPMLSRYSEDYDWSAPYGWKEPTSLPKNSDTSVEYLEGDPY